MKNLIWILMLTAIISSCSNHLMAQWIQTNDPEGGVVRFFAVSGTNLFAGTDNGGVFLSTNNGASWTAVNDGLTARYVHALAVGDSQVLKGGRGLNKFIHKSHNDF